MLTDDFDFDRFLYLVRELVRTVPALQGRASLSPLEIMEEVVQYILDFNEEVKRFDEKQKKLNAILDQQWEQVRQLTAAVQARRSQVLQNLKESDQQCSDPKELQELEELNKQRQDSESKQAASESGSADSSSSATMTTAEHD